MVKNQSRVKFLNYKSYLKPLKDHQTRLLFIKKVFNET